MPPSFVRPAVLNGQTNGRLPSSILVTTPGQAGGPDVRLVSPAARAWRALCAAAAAAGHVLKATSYGDSYRWYDLQYEIFHKRYSTSPVDGYIATRTCGGVLYYQRPGTAMAACPGTSNHGWGLAVDTGEEIDHDAGTESLDAETLAWLVVNARRFGFWWEVQSEPWHIRYCTGDAIPAAVLAYEEADMALTESEHYIQHVINWRVAGIIAMSDPVTSPAWTAPSGKVFPATSMTNSLARAVLAEGGGGVLTPADLVAVSAAAESGAEKGVADAAPAIVEAVETETRDAVADLGEGGAAQVRADE
jgi:hypothetical protein